MKYFIFSTLALVFYLSSCETKKERVVSKEMLTDSVIIDSISANNSIPTGDNSKVSVDWEGEYEGILPCADCEGIKTNIILDENDTYKFSTQYLGKNYKNEEKGKFSWSKDGNSISIKLKSGDNANFIVGEDQLVQLDQEGKQITGSMAEYYILKKKK